MEKKTYTVTDANGRTISIPVNVNKKLKEKNKKSGLGKKIATTALVLSLGVGAIIGGHHLANHINEKLDRPAIVSMQGENQEYTEDVFVGDLRFDPNSKENIVEKATFLIEDAAKCGKELDAEDAVLAVIVANSDEMTSGFYGQLFGERENQTYTYGKLVDAYLRVGMMEVENMSLATNDDRAFNTENIFANHEDYNYLLNIRNLTTRFNNSTDATEKKQIADELNALALNLCTYDAYDISSPAGVLSMLSLDGMRIQTITNSEYTVLPDDIRDEMFGNGDYGCRSEATFASNDGQVLPTHYSYRVNDLKLDSVKGKLDNAVLKDGQPTILNDIIGEVREKTKDVTIAQIDVVAEINEMAEQNRDISYAYEAAPGVVNPNYSPVTDNDKIEEGPSGPVVVTENPNPHTSENVEEAKSEKEAQDELERIQAEAQAAANRGAADGKYDGENGLPKRSISGESEHYISAYNTSYEVYKEIYDINHEQPKEELVPEEEIIDLNSLSTGQLQELKKAAGYESNVIENNEKTMK